MTREIKTSRTGVRYFEVPCEMIGAAKFVVDCNELPPGVIGVNACGEDDPLPEEYFDAETCMLFKLDGGSYVVKLDPIEEQFTTHVWAGDFKLVSE